MGVLFLPLFDNRGIEVSMRPGNSPTFQCFFFTGDETVAEEEEEEMMINLRGVGVAAAAVGRGERRKEEERESTIDT